MPNNDYLETRELYHFGIKGQKWGVRRFQNEDGTLTDVGKKKFGNRPKMEKYYREKAGRQAAASIGLGAASGLLYSHAMSKAGSKSGSVALLGAQITSGAQIVSNILSAKNLNTSIKANNSKMYGDNYRRFATVNQALLTQGSSRVARYIGFGLGPTTLRK